MSLLDLILGQKLIILTLGVALLLIVAAFSLGLVSRINRVRAERKRFAKEAEEMEADEVVVDTPVGRQKAVNVSAVAPNVTKPGMVVHPPIPALTAKPPVTLISSEQTHPSSGEPEIPSAMQDILSSVFADESNSERQAALLRDMAEVDISHLLTLCQQVSIQIRGGNTTSVVGSEELK